MYDSTVATMNVSDARNHLLDAMETARTETVFLQRRGRLAGVLVSPERYEQLMGHWKMPRMSQPSTPQWPRRAQHPMGSGQIRPRLGVSPYRIELRPSAVRSLRKLDQKSSSSYPGRHRATGPRSATSRCQGTQAGQVYESGLALTELSTRSRTTSCWSLSCGSDIDATFTTSSGGPRRSAMTCWAFLPCFDKQSPDQRLFCEVKWPGAGSNRRPSDFQSDARTN